MPEETVLLLVTPKRNDARIDRDLNLNNWHFFFSTNKNQETQWWIVIFWPGHAICLFFLTNKEAKAYLDIYFFPKCVVDQDEDLQFTWDREERIVRHNPIICRLFELSLEKKYFLSSEFARNQSFCFLGIYSRRIITTEPQRVSNSIITNFLSK